MATIAAVNRQWWLASYPEGMPSKSNWTLAEAQVPGPDRMLKSENLGKQLVRVGEEPNLATDTHS